MSNSGITSTKRKEELRFSAERKRDAQVILFLSMNAALMTSMDEKQEILRVSEK